MRSRISLFPLLAILFLSACDRGESGQPGQMPADTWFDLSVGGLPIRAQLAVTATEMRKGLMYRDSLPANHGMLFVYQRPQQVSFWMANTAIPLDLGLFDTTGTLREIHRLVPYDTQSVVSRSDEIQVALEMSQGWFAANGLFPGSTIDRESLARALQQRGMDPRLYGLD